MTDFKKLKVWQKAVPTNIVEGCGQQSSREFSRFLRIALNSTSELEYHLLVARDLTAVRASDSLTLITQVIEVRKMLYGLLCYLKHRSADKSEAPQSAKTQA
jgi:four helix bundle protein